MKIGPGVSGLWGVENSPLPFTRPMAYTTACTTIQAVILHEKCPDNCLLFSSYLVLFFFCCDRTIEIKRKYNWNKIFVISAVVYLTRNTKHKNAKIAVRVSQTRWHTIYCSIWYSTCNLPYLLYLLGLQLAYFLFDCLWITHRPTAELRQLLIT